MIEYLPLATAIGGMISGFLVGLACNGDVKALNETINGHQSEIDRLSDLVATLQAKVPARNARGKFVAR